MSKPLSFFNWSLKKAIDIEPDSFIKARIGIVYTILLFALLKAAVVIGLGATNEQWLQVGRACIAFVFYISMLKVLLYKPSSLKLLSHIMIMLGILIVFSNVFVYAHKINLVTLQFVSMIMLSGFYILGGTWGIIYSVVSILPVMLFLLLHGNVDITLSNSQQEFGSPGYEIIVILNFISIVISHYLFYRAFTVNIREKEKLNHELQLSVAEAVKLAESRANFLSTISHELRTPLNSVVGIAELLQQDKPVPHQQENLKILQFSALDLLSLINNVLDFNKIDSDKLVLEAVPFGLSEFMQNICSGLKKKTQDKQLGFTLDIDEQLKNTCVVSDPTRLSQLIYNLVSNAIKFTETGSVTVKLECTEKTENGVEVLFSVKDTGIGIHPDRQGKIFEMFTQAESHITRKYGGSGLGLAIVKQVLTLFNSSIHLESSPGNGSRFFFTIPFVTTAPIVEKKAPAADNKPDISQLKILIAEDNNFNRLIIKKQMETLHIEPVIVENGELAYEALLSGSYDAVFLDLHMPILDGYETTKQIRALADPVKAKIYTVAFTASVTELQKITDGGFDSYLYKPVNMNDLREQLEKIALNNQEPVLS